MDKERTGQGTIFGSVENQGWPLQIPAASSQYQRASIRKERTCVLQIRIGQSHVLTQSVHDLSLTGVFVEMKPDTVLIGDPAEVCIGFMDSRGRSCEHCITAEVVRVQPEGVALKFNQYGNRAYTDLVNFLYS